MPDQRDKTVRLLVPGQARPDQRNRIYKISHPRGKQGLIITVSVALVLILLVNILAYFYLQTYPPYTNAFRIWDSFSGIQSLDKRVDTLLLGDSSSGENLDVGAFSDRLGGQAFSLSIYGGMSVLTDAWLLSDYIQKFGPPHNVVFCILSDGYSATHTVELMAAPSLNWDYWDQLGVAPAWKDGELRNLFFTKYLVMYSYSDIFRGHLYKFWDLFDKTRDPMVPFNSYTLGDKSKQATMDITTRQPTSYFNEFNPSLDTTNAIQYMTDLARQQRFQLYFLFPPEWDEAVNAGLRQPILEAQVKYLSRFIDPTFVHIFRNASLTFNRDQIQNQAHLRPGSDHVKTESDLSGIISIQNQLTAERSQPLKVDSLKLDRNIYLPEDVPTVKLTISNLGKAGVTGSVSCLVKPSGETDGYWVKRAPASSFALEADGKLNLNLKLTVGDLEKAGVYDLVVFLRQDVGNLSNEIRVELPDKLVVE